MRSDCCDGEALEAGGERMKIRETVRATVKEFLRRKAHSDKTDVGIATATKVLVKQVLLAQHKRIAKSSLRARFGRLPKSAANTQKFFIRAEVVACSFGRTLRSCIQNHHIKDTQLETSFEQRNCISLTWALSKSKQSTCSSALHKATCAAECFQTTRTARCCSLKYMVRTQSAVGCFQLFESLWPPLLRPHQDLPKFFCFCARLDIQSGASRRKTAERQEHGLGAVLCAVCVAWTQPWRL